MADSNLKRSREESIILENDYPEEDTKRYKSYNHILSILEDEEDDEPNQDLSDILTSLQQELSSEDLATGSGGDYLESLSSPAPETETDRMAVGGETERLEMMRHLLEASDDELGIPNKVESSDEGTDGGVEVDGAGERLGDLVNGLWEFEDEAANYYALLQSELFL